MNKEVYTFLNSARTLHWQWLRLKAKHDELEYALLPGAIRYDKDKVQSSPDDQMSKIVSEIFDLEAEMRRIQIRKLNQINKIDKAISSIDSDESRTALTMRYINRIPVPTIAHEMGYAESTIYKFMDQGGEQISLYLKSV